uniref:Uncharacterized protein n=1 Tax=Arundo donax TaxID=35708 RepID=A0A0A8Y7A0_ARUDO
MLGRRFDASAPALPIARLPPPCPTAPCNLPTLSTACRHRLAVRPPKAFF